MLSVRPFSTPLQVTGGILHSPSYPSLLSHAIRQALLHPSTGNCGHTAYPFLPQSTWSCRPSSPSPPPLQVTGGILHTPFYPSLLGHVVHQAPLHPLYRFSNWGHTPTKNYRSGSGMPPKHGVGTTTLLISPVLFDSFPFCFLLGHCFLMSPLIFQVNLPTRPH
jgi:hypothetical protein